jgi:6-phosphogluconolactonase
VARRYLVVSFKIEVLPDAFFAPKAAARIAVDLPAPRSVVLTGGTTAEKIYRPLVETGISLSGRDVFFSDERCVPVDHEASNFVMAKRTLLDLVNTGPVHRMRGEDDPDVAAAAYSEEVAGAAPGGFDLVLLGMGADCHVAAMFPGSPALDETEALCAAIDRPDGMRGLTLTPPGLLNAKKILLIVSGSAKAEATARVVEGNEEPATCPARLLANHEDVTFLLDEAAAARL